jgi:hypothetical protein
MTARATKALPSLVTEGCIAAPRWYRTISNPLSVVLGNRGCHLTVLVLLAENVTILRYPHNYYELNWRQVPPLAAQVEQTQNVVEDRVTAQFFRGAATALAQMRQDKLLELRHVQIRWNSLPWLAFRHPEHKSDGILCGSPLSTKPLSAAVRRQIPAVKNPR